MKTTNMKNIQHFNGKNIKIHIDTTCLFQFTLKTTSIFEKRKLAHSQVSKLKLMHACTEIIIFLLI